MNATIKELVEFEKGETAIETRKIKSKKDMVNHPPHYNQSGIECLDAIQAATDEGFEYYLQGNVMKYLWRYRYKNGIEDIDKAIFYLNKLRKVLKDASKSNDDFKS
jgi:hypothetical protein|tara:strand:+ start:1021 stop:1338 length:318 start_codon:yes stop_codon:yes gene_type:complete